MLKCLLNFFIYCTENLITDKQSHTIYISISHTVKLTLLQRHKIILTL
jgi:hypothetical protein